MKVTIDLNNVIILDSEDMVEIAAFVTAFRNGVVEAKPESLPRSLPRKPPAKKSKSAKQADLSPETFDTWQFLVNNDRLDGLYIHQIAHAMGCTNHAATWRCNKLIAKGLAHRPKRGYYRAGDGQADDDAPVI
jgi:hypothetical protein